jgi:hypothetical protein
MMPVHLDSPFDQSFDRLFRYIAIKCQEAGQANEKRADPKARPALI